MRNNTLDQIVDTNVTLGHWPFRRVPDDEPAELVEKLKTNGVTQVWAGNFEGLFHRDLSSVNERLAETCRATAPNWLIPFGSINPTLPDWETDLKRCVEQFQMPGIRLHPNYHDYQLDHPEFARLLELAAERNLIVQLALLMEDKRTQPHLAHVPHVDVKPLPGLLKQHPPLRLELLNAFQALSIDQAAELLTARQVWVEIATLESVGGVEKLTEKVPAERILFGSHFPLFYFESALFKMRESELAQGQRDLIFRLNAQKLLGKK